MSILALALLLSSAALHALWNLLLKKSEDKYIAMGWQVIFSAIIAVIALFFSGLPPRTIWIYVLISMTLEAIYFGVLTLAYTDHDFSLVYPVARGAAPALVVLWTAIFLGEIPSPVGFIGILLVICGLIVIGITSLLQETSGKPQWRGIMLALLVALVISMYTLVDGYAVKHSPALSYGLGLFVLVPFLTTPLIAAALRLETDGGRFAETARAPGAGGFPGDHRLFICPVRLLDRPGQLLGSHPRSERGDGRICRLVFPGGEDGEDPHHRRGGDLCGYRADSSVWVKASVRRIIGCRAYPEEISILDQQPVRNQEKVWEPYARRDLPGETR